MYFFTSFCTAFLCDRCIFRQGLLKVDRTATKVLGLYPSRWGLQGRSDFFSLFKSPLIKLPLLQSLGHVLQLLSLGMQFIHWPRLLTVPFPGVGVESVPPEPCSIGLASFTKKTGMPGPDEQELENGPTDKRSLLYYDLPKWEKW